MRLAFDSRAQHLDLSDDNANNNNANGNGSNENGGQQNGSSRA